MFLLELCDIIGVPRPAPSGHQRELNDYAFERAVSLRESATTNGSKFIDLYKKNAFILEAKQSRLPDGRKVERGKLAPLTDEPANLGQRSIAKGWDVLMKNARQQAESYVFLLDADHPAPPFIIVCDVGHCLELYADFTGTGRAYGHFPDRNRFRIYMDDLRKDDVRAHLKRIWQEPHSLDPSKEAARVTRDIAKRLAQVSKGLEERGCTAEDVAHFLMRCIFTMFAEDVELLPKGAFTQLLKECIDHPDAFAPLLEELWAKMDEPQHERRFYSLFKTHLRHFNGSLFKQARAFPLGREEIGELLAAAKLFLDRGRSRDLRHPSRTGPRQGRAQEARRALHAPRLCAAPRGSDRHGAPARGLAERPAQGRACEGDRRREGGDCHRARLPPPALRHAGAWTLPAAPATFSTSRSS